MDPTLAAILGVFFRWLHIMSVVVLIGGILYARSIGGKLAPSFRTTIYGGIVALLISGLYNFLTKPSYPPHYHMWFGIKMLLVLHVFAVSILLTVPAATEEKQRRRMTGIAISATVIIAISAYLRWISLTPVVKLP
jgi:hypothetical protein